METSIVPLVTKAISDHFAQNVNMGANYTDAPHEIAQVFMQIVGLHQQQRDLPEPPADYYRALLIAAGFPADFADKFIDDDQPDAIY